MSLAGGSFLFKRNGVDSENREGADVGVLEWMTPAGDQDSQVPRISAASALTLTRTHVTHVLESGLSTHTVTWRTLSRSRTRASVQSMPLTLADALLNRVLLHLAISLEHQHCFLKSNETA